MYEENLIANKSVIRNNTLYILFTIALLLLSFIPFVMQGMSPDGVLYSGFAYNLAHGISSLWSPSLTPTLWSTFHAHPPLSFYFHSLFLSYLGDYLFVDKIYFSTTALTTLFLVILCWRKCNPKINLCFYWVPILYWVLILENMLESYRGNIDATLMVFTTLATYLIFKACSQQKRKYLYFICAAISIIVSFFINGCQAFFLLLVPIIYHYVVRQKNLWSGIKQTLLLGCITFTGIIVFLCTNDAAWEHMHLYLFDKLLYGSLMGESEHLVIGRFRIFWVIIKNLSPALLFSITCFLTYSRKYHQPLSLVFKRFLNNRHALFFFLIALTASLPVIVSPHQTSRYIAASYPMWALGFSVLLTPLFVSFTQQKDFKSKGFVLFSYLGLAFLGWSMMFGYFCSGKTLYGKPVLEDIDQLKSIIPAKTEISVNAATLDGKWAYFLRLQLYRDMQIVSYDTIDKPYYLQGKQLSTYPQGYRPVNIPFQTFALYKRVFPTHF